MVVERKLKKNFHPYPYIEKYSSGKEVLKMVKKKKIH